MSSQAIYFAYFAKSLSERLVQEMATRKRAYASLFEIDIGIYKKKLFKDCEQLILIRSQGKTTG